MTICQAESAVKLQHYYAWLETWLTTTPSKRSPDECLRLVIDSGPRWLDGSSDAPEDGDTSRVEEIVACSKTATKARLVRLGGKVPPSHDACDVMSESYNARVECECSGLFPVPDDFDARTLKTCGCKAIERMISGGELVNSTEDEWNSSAFFNKNDLSLAMTELALCNAEVQPRPFSCHGNLDKPSDWPEVQAPDRKPNGDIDLEDEMYRRLYPTREQIRFSSDAKHFFALVSGVSLVDPGIQMAMADPGNDILIGDYCDAASDEALVVLQKSGAAAFGFLKLRLYAGLMTDWQFDNLVAQVIHFRVIGYYRDHALPRRPAGLYGSRVTALDAHRYIDLGMAVGVINASLATGQTMTAADFRGLVSASVLINDLVDFRGDTWRNQRENVVLRAVRGNLCRYLDGSIEQCIRKSAAAVRRGRLFAFVVMCFCNWMLRSSGHKLFETYHGTRLIATDPPCLYRSQQSSAYQELLEALSEYGTLGEAEGPSLHLKRRDLQLRYAKHRVASETHIRWMADVVRIVLNPNVLRRLVDVVHYQWVGELGSINYCT